jgi:hypothetical protein
MTYLAIITSLLVGYVIGLVQKGITVNINHKDREIPTQYNESLVQELPDEVKQYYHETNGFNKY